MLDTISINNKPPSPPLRETHALPGNCIGTSFLDEMHQTGLAVRFNCHSTDHLSGGTQHLIETFQCLPVATHGGKDDPSIIEISEKIDRGKGGGFWLNTCDGVSSDEVHCNGVQLG